MLGTLNGALEVRQVFLESDALQAEVEGVNQVVDGLPLLREVRIHYRIRVPKDARASGSGLGSPPREMPDGREPQGRGDGELDRDDRGDMTAWIPNR